jgi:predicted O-methyltransferase YrrM
LNLSQFAGTISAHLHYFFHAVDEHSLQSPFAFRFYTEAIKAYSTAQHIPEAEACRSRLRTSGDLIKCPDPGAGSRLTGKKTKKVSNIAKYGVSTPRTCRLLTSIAAFYRAQNIIELGTSLGIGSMYLAGNPQSQVHTFEACAPLVNLAESNFRTAGFENIIIHEGNIDETLPAFLVGSRQVDVLFIDASHRKQSLLHFFQLALPKMSARSIIIVDDIRWSNDMYKGWLELAQRDVINLSLDLGNLGLLILEQDYPKQHFVLTY